jgi:hypothetical protein
MKRRYVGARADLSSELDGKHVISLISEIF